MPDQTAQTDEKPFKGTGVELTKLLAGHPDAPCEVQHDQAVSEGPYCERDFQGVIFSEQSFVHPL